MNAGRRAKVCVTLREAIAVWEEKTDQKMTYVRLADITGLSRDTISSLATRNAYNSTLETVSLLCTALGCELEQVLKIEWETGRPPN